VERADQRSKYLKFAVMYDPFGITAKPFEETSTATVVGWKLHLGDVLHVRRVLLACRTWQGKVFNATVLFFATGAKPVPVIVTIVPPIAVPERGERAVTVGVLATWYVNFSERVAKFAGVLPKVMLTLHCGELERMTPTNSSSATRQ